MDKREKRRRMNIIWDVVKFRKDKNAVQCFNDDCQEIKEIPIISKKIRRRGDGTIQTIETDTGNIRITCDTHNWNQLFSVSQLDNMPMPGRVTTVSDIDPKVENIQSGAIER